MEQPPPPPPPPLVPAVPVPLLPPLPLPPVPVLPPAAHPPALGASQARVKVQKAATHVAPMSLHLQSASVVHQPSCPLG